jgi:aminomethyltransferase
MATLRTSLFDSHVSLGGRMVEFAGWELPVQYQSVIAEAKAVREGAGMFDVGHMARLWLRGERVLEFLEHITTNDVAALEDGRGHYSLLPNERGGCVDDIIVYRIEEGVFRMVVNAANHAKDVAWIKSKNTFGVDIIDETMDTAMIAVQGPEAGAIVGRLCPDGHKFEGLPFFGVVNTTIAGVDCFAPRSGYTGEDGFELICKTNDAPKLWNALLERGVRPCGLASRDTLRVEAGLPLYGHELGDDINPISAGLGWVISKTKSFIGSEPINEARASGTTKKLQGVRLNSKRLIAPGMKVYVEGKDVGEVSSGVFSPLLDCGIAFAFVDSSIKLGTECAIEVRGTMEPGTVVNKRFFVRSK